MSSFCPYCRGEVAVGELFCCPTCQTPHHQACWGENGGCTVWGCAQAPDEGEKITISAQDQEVADRGSGGVSHLGEPPSSVEYFFVRNGNRMGPYSLDDARQFLAQGRLAETDLAWREGLVDWLPLPEVLGGGMSQPLVATASFGPPLTAPGPTSVGRGAVFLYISATRFVAMSLVTFGLYQMYWMYRNWRFLKERDNLSIEPFWRGVLGIFYVRELLKSVRNDRNANGIIPCWFSDGSLAGGWILLVVIGSALGWLSNPAVCTFGILLQALSFLFLLPVQEYVNRVNERLPLAPKHDDWSVGQTIVLVVGVIHCLRVTFAALASLSR